MRYTLEHSPEPWRLQQLETAHHGYADWPTYVVRSAVNICVATVGDVDHYESDRIPANARLIAQAPAMADLLRRLLTEYFNPTWPDMHFGFPEEIRHALEEAGIKVQLTVTP